MSVVTSVATVELRTLVAHALARRTTSESVLVRASLSGNGVSATGLGESIARDYVTGETTASVVAAIAAWTDELRAAGARDVAGWLDLLDDLSRRAQSSRETAAFAGFEVAVLDALARMTRRPVGAIVGAQWPERVPMSLPLLASSVEATRRLARGAAFLGARRVKLKVGIEHDSERLAVARTTLPGAELWVDANGAWSVDEAIERACALREQGVVVIEQPVAPRVSREHPDVLRRIERQSGVRVSADESVVTHADADELLRAGSPAIWNLRVAKCGGIRATLSLAERAHAHGIAVQIGALVAESSLLAVAALWVAGGLPFPTCAFEAGQGVRIVRQELASPSVLIDGDGCVPPASSLAEPFLRDAHDVMKEQTSDRHSENSR